MAHLLLADGQVDLVSRVVSAKNFAYVPELRADGLQEWADANGLTIAELARIQPSYEPRCGGVENCVTECCDDTCTNFNAQTVCGDDGVTYGSEDIARSWGAEVDSEGACPDDGPNCATSSGGSLGLLLALLRARRRQDGRGRRAPTLERR